MKKFLALGLILTLLFIVPTTQAQVIRVDDVLYTGKRFTNSLADTVKTVGGSTFEITMIKAVIGSLIVAFALLELSPRFQALAFPPRWLPLGGALSGFFGGLSGNQGALRSAFLLKSGLSKEAFVATGVVSAVIVDAARLAVYGASFMASNFAQSQELLAPVAVGTVCAFIGSFMGKRMLQKVTLRTVQIVVAAAMLLIGTGLAAGLV